MSHYIKDLHAKAGKSFQRRENFDEQWDDIIRFIRPNTPEFNEQTTQGDIRGEEVFDGSAIQDLQQFVSGLYANSISGDWFRLTLKDRIRAQDRDVREYLEFVENAIYDQYDDPDSSFTLSTPEGFWDIGAFGTAVQFQDLDEGQLHFRTFPLRMVGIEENSKGLVDEVYVKDQFTIKQIIQEFGEDALPEDERKKKDTEKLTVIHAVAPANLRVFKDVNLKGKKFASIYYLEKYHDDEKVPPLQESGFDQFPYHVPRWTKIAGETYGRGQGMLAIYDVRSMQKIRANLMEASEKAVNPIIVANESAIIGDVSMEPGDVIYVNNLGQTGRPIEQAFVHGDIPAGFEMLQETREQVRNYFFVNLMVRQRKKERQTAFEIADERDEMLKQLAPMSSRMEKEWFSPMIKRSIFLLDRAQILPEPPDGVTLKDIKVFFTSPSARAQRGFKIASIRQYFQIAAEAAQLDPRAVKAVDGVDALRVVAEELEVPSLAVRDLDEIAAMEVEEQQQQAALLQSEIQKNQASAAKDLAGAQSTSSQSPAGLI